MSDLISRQDAIELIHTLYPSAPIMRMNRKRWEEKYKPYIEAEKVLEKFPSAQPRKGKWIIYSTFEDCYYAKCDQCHETQVFYYNKPLTNFCPNCGCRMEEGDAE